MTIDTVQPTLNVQAVHPKQEAREQAGRKHQHDDKPGQDGPDQGEAPFVNSLGQLTGKTINITA